MNACLLSSNSRKLLWPVSAVAISVLLSLNPFYQPDIPLSVGIAAWFADMAMVLVLLMYSATVRLGILITGFFFAVPCFLWASPLARGLLMNLMAVPFVLAAAFLYAPSTAGFRGRLAFFFSWCGTHEIGRRPSSLDISSLLRLLAATLTLAIGLAGIKTAPLAGPGLLARWLAGGIAIFAFAEMATASHDLLTSWLGITAPSLMRSPVLSTSVADFWARRWNVATSQLGFRPLFFLPLARYGIFPGLFAAFLASAVAHFCLALILMGRWEISLVCWAFFAVQPFLILTERAMNVRRWPTAAARVWTLTALAVASPLFVEPVIQLITPSLRAAGNLLSPTIATLGYAMIMNLFFNVGQLAFCARFPAPDSTLKLPLSQKPAQLKQ